MKSSYTTRSAPQGLKLALIASGAVFTAGCANMTTTAPAVLSQGSAAVVSGKLHGGNQPIAFATVTVSAVGFGNFGAPSTLLATTTTADDGAGSFSFTKDPVVGASHPNTGSTYACPSGADSLIYLTARGGNTINSHDSSVVNNAAAFIAPLGFCTQVNNSFFVSMNEVTTVATLAAVGQYFNPDTGSIGASGSGASYNALANAFQLVSTMANLPAGSANASKTFAGAGGLAAISVVATPESTKINHIANVLASCVNNATSNNSNCFSLFTNATPPSGVYRGRGIVENYPVATDVLQAGAYMLLNPTDGSPVNLQNLYNLAPAAGAPFQPGLITVPSDWTIAIAYNSAGTCGSTNGSFINDPYGLGIDVNGNVWVNNGGAVNGNLVQVSALGIPQRCVFLSGNSKAGGVIDTAGNVWSTSGTSANIFRYKPSDGSVLTFSTVAVPVGLTADGLGNIYFSTAADTSLYKIPSAATLSAAVTPIQVSSVVGPNPVGLYPDSTNNIWASSGSGFISRITPTSDTTQPNFVNGYSTTQFNAPSPTVGISTTFQGNVWTVSASPSNTYTYFTGSGVAYTPASGFPTASNFGGLNNPNQVAVDSSNVAWAINNSNNTNGTGSVSGVSFNGTALTPSGVTAGGFQKPLTYINAGRSIIIDQSGNMWVGNDGSPNVLTELVGVAQPLEQPFSTGLVNGRFQTSP